MSLLTDGKVLPTADVSVQRSTFKDPHSYKTTFTSGRLIPVYAREILPGDSLKVDSSFLIRMLTPVVPVMDNAFIDLRFFFVPARLCMNPQGKDDKSFQRMMGENTTSHWSQDDGSLPSSARLTGDIVFNKPDTSGTLWDYFGLPFFTSGDVNAQLDISLNEFRFPDGYLNGSRFLAYQLVWNEWYRSENLQDPRYYSVDVVAASEPYPVCKLHDVFTDALPSPQKGSDVLLNFLSGLAPVVGSGAVVSSSDPYQFLVAGQPNKTGALGLDQNTLKVYTSVPSGSSSTLNASNLKADLSAPGINSGSVNQLRTSFALQRQLEKDARGGTRYREKLKTTFGVDAPDSFLDIPEYLGGKRVPISMDTVLQTSMTSGNSALGDTGAFSVTGDSSFLVDKSFVEHGYVLGLVCVRTEQSYFQGISRDWVHTNRNSFYSPTFANIGEQPISKTEIYAGDIYLTSPTNYDEVFGYQEAWYEYRHTPNAVTGRLNPVDGINQLSHWTYANALSNKPTLSASWLLQSSKNIGDILVDKNTDTQFVADFAFDDTISRAMPLYSVPGLIDHF